MNSTVMHKEYIGNWNELIREKAISDLFRIISKCNDEIAEIVDKYRLIMQRITNEMDCYQYTSEEFMQLEANLSICRGYFTQDTDETFEEYIGTKNIDTDEIEYDKGTILTLELIYHYAEALKKKVIESASDDLIENNLD